MRSYVDSKRPDRKLRKAVAICGCCKRKAYVDRVEATVRFSCECVREGETCYKCCKRKCHCDCAR